ncbi:MAG: TonB family protein [Acidobacteriaceae bacterium]|nr:TonB family protein [Acidobacteriaceae bacterium]
MVKPLRSELVVPPDMRFTHLGVLNAGTQSKGSVFTSLTINLICAVCGILMATAAAKETLVKSSRTVTLVEPVYKTASPPPVKAELPKVQPTEVSPPDPSKLPELKSIEQTPVPSPSKPVEPPPAPQVSLARAAPAAVPNWTPHPTAVALGQPDSPIAPSSRLSDVNLGQRGVSGMASSGSGQGPRAAAVHLGSGSAASQNMNGRDIQDVRLGAVKGAGPLNSTASGVAVQVAGSVPKVLYKPRPKYTDEARRLRIEGTITVRVRVLATGAVKVLGISSDLGHGLAESAIRAIEATRFQPATDGAGKPVEWEGIVNVNFQLAEQTQG